MAAGVTTSDAHVAVTTATVGLLFSDIEGSTRLLQQLGADYPRVLLEHRALLRVAFAAHRGEEQGTEGDSFFVTFPSAADAVGAALAAQLALAGHSWPAGAAVRVRMGVHVGEILTVAGTIVGLAVHEAARVSAVGHGGQVLVSALAAERAGPLPDGATWVDLGRNDLKDIATPMHLFQLAHERLAQAFPPPREHGTGRNNLPAQTSAFIGRNRELLEVKDLLNAARLLTITGAGGVGKSRLALRAAADHGTAFPDGVWFVDLAPVSDPSAVRLEVVAALSLPDASAADLAAAIGSRRLLVLMDNCEHLVEEVSEVVDDLLRRCAGVTVLATSREPLGLPGEVAWRVPSLEDGDAVALFCARARAVNPRFELTDANRSAVDDVVRRLDAIPLALELAAARLASLSVAQVAGRLDQRFRLLSGGARGAVARQRTLQATVDWSYDLLEPHARTVLRRLGVFVGGFTVEAAEAVCACDEIDTLDVFDHLDQLVAKSLVVAEEQGGTVRYRLLETIRQYALDRLIQHSEVDDGRGAHLAWVQQLLAAAEPTIWFGGDDEGHWLARLDDELANVRAGFDWALDGGAPSVASSILIVVYPWFLARGRAREGLEWCARLQAANGSDEDRAFTAFVELLLSDNADAVTDELFDRVRRDAASLPDSSRPWLAPVVKAHLAGSLHPKDAAAAAAAVLACQDAVEEARGTNTTAMGMTLQCLTWAFTSAGDFAAAKAAGEEALDLAQRAGLSIGESRISGSLAELALHAGDLDTAWRRAEHAVHVARRTGDAAVVAEGSTFLAEVLAQRGDASGARDILLSVLDRDAELQTDERLAELHTELAWLSVFTGDAESAGRQASLALRHLSVDADRRPSALGVAGEAARLLGDLPGAWGALLEAAVGVRRLGSPDPHLLVALVEGMAGVRLDLGDTTGAVRLLGAARVHRPPTPPLGELRARHLATLAERAQTQLSEAAFGAAMSEGGLLDLDAAVAAGLEMPAPPR